MAKKLVIKGKVHGVGYRVKLIQLALEYGIERFNTFNTFIDSKQAVVCLIDAPNEIIEFIKQRAESEKPEKALIESISVENYAYEVPPIERCMQAFQMEHWGKAIPILLDMRDKQDGTIRAIREESEKTRQTVREESEKTRQTVREESEKTRVELGTKIDNLGAKIDSARDGIAEKIDLLRMDLREYIEANLKEIHSKISEIEKALKKAGIM